MSNPVVSFDFNIPTPSSPNVVRNTYQALDFSSVQVVKYETGQSFSGLGEMVLISKTAKDALTNNNVIPLTSTPSSLLPSDIPWFLFTDYTPTTSTDYSDLAQTLSISVNGHYTCFPTPLVPVHSGMVKNGWFSALDENGVDVAPYSDFSMYKFPAGTLYGAFNETDGFNWKVKTPIFEDEADFEYYCHCGPDFKWISIDPKKDDVSASEVPKYPFKITLENPLVPPVDPQGRWDASHLVGNGAFMLSLLPTPIGDHQTDPSNFTNEPEKSDDWSITVSLGSGSCPVKIVWDKKGVRASVGDNVRSVSLVKQSGAGGSSYHNSMASYGRESVCFLVVPVWNGILVTSGYIDASNTTFAATHSTFVPKFSNLNYIDYITFDPLSPSSCEVPSTIDGQDVMVDLTPPITIEGKRTSLQVAYVPVFFAPRAGFQTIILANTNTPDNNYNYYFYAFWTKNSSTYSVVMQNPVMAQDSSVPDTAYYGAACTFSQPAGIPLWTRRPPEIFSILSRRELTSTYVQANGNGNYSLTWSGGTPGDDAATKWEDYVQSVDCELNLDGSSGNIVVDKYGIAGQTAIPEQSVGAIVLRATGGANTTPGTIFYGLGFGVDDQKGDDGATWTIPLFGLEKKLDEMLLINVPFFDGYTFFNAADFLSKYAGLVPDFSNADQEIVLKQSTDLNIPYFDWKSGTSVRTALDDICKDTNHVWVCMDGKIKFYQVGANGLPLSLGTDWAPQYPDTKVERSDQKPDFEDIRNEIVVFALSKSLQGGAEANPNNISLSPSQGSCSQTTNPSFPWAKPMVHAVSGFLDDSECANIAQRYAAHSRRYEMMGSVTIPGNGSIRLYDRWGGDIIYSVKHTLDLTSKSWKTSLSLMKSAAGA